MYKYETHLHTSATSACAGSTPKEQVMKLYREGYTGTVVTDHFMNGNSLVNRRLNWPDQIKAFAKGYYQALEAAEGLDFDVFFGFEYTYLGTDFLIYGITIQQLIDEPLLMGFEPRAFFDWVHDLGGFVIHAHPFRNEFYIPKVRLYTDHIDAVEVKNGGNRSYAENQKAFDYALENNLPMTKGSDLHSSDYFHDGGMSFSRRATDIFDLIEMIKGSYYTSLD